MKHRIAETEMHSRGVPVKRKAFQPDQEPVFDAEGYCKSAIATIIAVLAREGYSKSEAIEWIMEAKQAIREGTDPEEILYEIGLEPDLIWGLI